MGARVVQDGNTIDASLLPLRSETPVIRSAHLAVVQAHVESIVKQVTLALIFYRVPIIETRVEGCLDLERGVEVETLSSIMGAQLKSKSFYNYNKC